MESFYVTVQSDASAEYYTSNKLTNFRNHLAVPINVDSTRYEVALSEMSYTYNAPYIRKGTELFSLYRVPETFKPSTKRIPTEETTATEYDIDVLEYAKEHGYHLDSASAFMEALNLPREKGKQKLSIGTAKIYAKKYINTTEDLIAELREQLSPLDIVFLQEVGEGINKLTITHRTPNIIVRKFPDYNPVLYDHFELAGASDGYDQGIYYVQTKVSNTPIRIRKGEWLLTIAFVQGEYESAEGGQERKTSTVLARDDIHTIQELSAALNRASEHVKVNVRGNVTHLKVKTPDTTKLVFDDRVLAILGVSSDTIIPAGTEVNRTGTETTAFDIGCRKIYIYTDIIENQRVGDQMAPLLRITDYTGAQDQTEIKDFNHLQYISVRQDNIEAIRIYIKTETGEDLPLSFGTVSCTLHFREKRF